MVPMVPEPVVYLECCRITDPFDDGKAEPVVAALGGALIKSAEDAIRVE